MTRLRRTPKTRLAARVAGEGATDFSEIWFVALDAIRYPEFVGPAVAHALAPRERSERTAWEQIAEYCGLSPALLVLDSFEQVVATVLDVVGLLMRCTEPKVLATSRVVLRASGEVDHLVPTLALPPNLSDRRLARRPLPRGPALARGCRARL